MARLPLTKQEANWKDYDRPVMLPIPCQSNRSTQKAQISVHFVPTGIIYHQNVRSELGSINGVRSLFERLCHVSVQEC